MIHDLSHFKPEYVRGQEHLEGPFTDRALQYILRCQKLDIDPDLKGTIALCEELVGEVNLTFTFMHPSRTEADVTYTHISRYREVPEWYAKQVSDAE